MGDEQGLEFKVTGTGTVRPAARVLRGHVVCRRPDGTIRWEADTVPVALAFGAGDAANPVRLTVPNPQPPGPDPGSGATS